MSPVFSALLDNSALTNLLNDAGKVNALKRLMATGRCRLIIPFDTLAEAFAGGNRDLVTARLQQLESLVQEFGDQRVVLAARAVKWAQNECRNGGIFKNIPSMRNSPRYEGLRTYLRDKASFAEYRDELDEWISGYAERKKILAEKDRYFRQLVKENGLDQEEIKGRLLAMAPPKISEIDSTIHLFRIFLPLSNRLARRILKPGQKYRFNRAWLMVMHARSLGNGITKFEPDSPILCFRGQKVGNWDDSIMIALASPFDYLISDDKDQRAITDFLKERSIVKCTGISSDDFLKF